MHQKDLYILIAISFDTLCGAARIYCYEKSCQEVNWNSKRKNLLISVWEVVNCTISKGNLQENKMQRKEEKILAKYGEYNEER